MVTLYSTGCPKCKVMKIKLEKAGIEYTENTDVTEINKVCEEIGADSVPILETPDGTFEFAKAIAWVGEHNV